MVDWVTLDDADLWEALQSPGLMRVKPGYAQKALEKRTLRLLWESLGRSWKCRSCSQKTNLLGHHPGEFGMYMSHYVHRARGKFRAKNLEKMRQEFQLRLVLLCAPCHQRAHVLEKLMHKPW